MLPLLLALAPLQAHAACHPPPTCTVAPAGAVYPTVTAALAGGCTAILLTHSTTDDVTIDASTGPVCVTGPASAVLTGTGTGPVVVVVSGALTLDGVTVSGGDAPCGGGVLVRPLGALTAHGLTVRENHADEGGGLCVEGTANLSATTVTANTADTRGGGLYLRQAGPQRPEAVLRAGTVVTLNVAQDGGGLALSGGLATTVDEGEDALGHPIFAVVAVEDNLATRNGGGAWAEDGALVAHGGLLLRGNTAGGAGGGGAALAGGGLSAVGADAHLVVSGNHADGPGGGLAVSGGVAAVEDEARLEVRGNTSDAIGGGIAAVDALSLGNRDSSPGTLEVVDNVAARAGGGLWARGCEASLLHTRLTGNRAGGDGGGAWLDGADQFALLQGSVVADNRSDSVGGGLRLVGPAPVFVVATTIARNTARDGGGVHGDLDSTLRVGAATIVENAAVHQGRPNRAALGQQLVLGGVVLLDATAVGVAPPGRRSCAFAPGTARTITWSASDEAGCVDTADPTNLVVPLGLAPFDGTRALRCPSPAARSSTSCRVGTPIRTGWCGRSIARARSARSRSTTRRHPAREYEPAILTATPAPPPTRSGWPGWRSRRRTCHRAARCGSRPG